MQPGVDHGDAQQLVDAVDHGEADGGVQVVAVVAQQVKVAVAQRREAGDERALHEDAVLDADEDAAGDGEEQRRQRDACLLVPFFVSCFCVGVFCPRFEAGGAAAAAVDERTHTRFTLSHTTHMHTHTHPQNPN